MVDIHYLKSLLCYIRNEISLVMDHMLTDYQKETKENLLFRVGQSDAALKEFSECINEINTVVFIPRYVMSGPPIPGPLVAGAHVREHTEEIPIPYLPMSCGVDCGTPYIDYYAEHVAAKKEAEKDRLLYEKALSEKIKVALEENIKLANVKLENVKPGIGHINLNA